MGLFDKEALAMAREANDAARASSSAVQQLTLTLANLAGEQAAHVKVCAERSKNTDDKIDKLVDQNIWQMRGLIMLLITAFGGLIFEIAKTKWGL